MSDVFYIEDLSLLRIMKSSLLLLSVLFLAGCSSSSVFTKEEESDIGQRLCNCVQKSMPALGTNAIDFLEFAVDHEEKEEEYLIAYIEEIRSELTGHEADLFEKDIEYLFNEFDMDAIFDGCGPSLLESYPSIEELSDEELVELLRDNTDTDGCEITHILLDLYARENT